MFSRPTLATLIAAVCVILIGIGASLAMAAEISREEYVERVEPICKTNSEANKKILAGVRAEVKQGKLKLAGAKFSKAATALKKTYRELKAVPQPSADEAKLTKWLSYVKKEAELFEGAAKALKDGNKQKAENYVVKLTHNANLANNTVLSFNFRYCKFEPSKYT